VADGDSAGRHLRGPDAPEAGVPQTVAPPRPLLWRPGLTGVAIFRSVGGTPDYSLLADRLTRTLPPRAEADEKGGQRAPGNRQRPLAALGRRAATGAGTGIRATLRSRGTGSGYGHEDLNAGHQEDQHDPEGHEPRRVKRQRTSFPLMLPDSLFLLLLLPLFLVVLAVLVVLVHFGPSLSKFGTGYGDDCARLITPSPVGRARWLFHFVQSAVFRLTGPRRGAPSGRYSTVKVGPEASGG
jgi:hypothetical protein